MPLLFAYGKNRFSHDVAHMAPSNCSSTSVSQVDPVLYGQMMMKDHFVCEIVAQSCCMSCHKRFKLLISGCKQSGVQLDDVVLPTWAKGDPREFIRAHREVTI